MGLIQRVTVSQLLLYLVKARLVKKLAFLFTVDVGHLCG